ncbi:uncharacterized protein LOC115761200 isoform X3 [Drosophila novamexicana]|uniref:uncharacterized protein LOC115761200 isoform X3 n=1 Tax=Drosophila novamexicana TaxID=47314 RepID=UPI0011E599D8|nr:uncharacterized protein LOC115761200 isoform X3 [Drosophila novamexicana]
MLLLLLAFIMRFVDISKEQRRQRCTACANADVECPLSNNNNSNSDANGNTTCWQHVADTSNSSSTSSGCDSNSSSKENYYVPQQQQQQQHNGNNGLTPRQLQQIRYYQCMQQQQLRLLQQQLMQQRRLQQQLREQGLMPPPRTRTTTTAHGLTCNQEYLMQQRINQNNNNNNNLRNYLSNNNENKSHCINNNNNNNNCVGVGINVPQGLQFRRGMTDISTINDNNNISNINRHIEHQQFSSKNKSPQSSPTHEPYTKTNLSSHPHPNSRFAKQQHSAQHQQQSLIDGGKQYNGNTAGYSTALASVSGLGSAPQSPQQHYRIPLNSPNNSLFALGHVTSGKRYKQQQLNDRLLQQQHLQFCQQQQLQQLQLRDEDADADAAEELSEESLKQNVAIVLSNLDRYNSALRSIILNEQVSNISDSDSLFLCDDPSAEADNNNFLKSNAMAATNIATPESDYNSNATTPGARSNELVQQQQQQQHGVGGLLCGGGVGVGVGNGGGGGNNLNCSLASSQDFTHDNSDYQWFLDYGYRDGCGGMQRSVLSSLSASYNAMGDFIYYEDLKNLDANLAEVDMESFRAEDIHSLLSQLPAYCKSLGGANSRLQQSLLYQQQQQQQQQQHQQQQQQQMQLQLQQSNMMTNMQHMAHNMSQTSTTSTNELIDNSFCKSELLFSPVKESHISVDSLDMDAYPDEGDIILTCNKDNYTIAFEGSVLYSDESFYAEPCDIAVRNKQNINLHGNLEDIVKRNKALEVSMSRSAQSFQFQCKSPKTQAKAQLQRRSLLLLSPARRYPSGNNNNGGGETIVLTRHLPHCSIRKSSSLPNLQSELQQQQHQDEREKDHTAPLNVSQAISTSTMESCTSRSRNLLPMCQMPISISVSISDRLQQQQTVEQHKDATPTPTPQQQQQQHYHHHSHTHRHKHRCGCALSSTQGSQHFCSNASQAHISGSASSGNSNPAAFNLVKLFIKQKSSSSSSCAQEEGQACALTCMDVSSGCWPSSDAAVSSCSSGSLEKRFRKKSMNDSGKGSAVSRHDDDDNYEEADAASTPKRQTRTRCDTVFYDDGASSSSTGSLTATNSPAHRRRSMPLRNPQLYQLAANTQTPTQCSQQSSEASNSEQLTQVPMGAKPRRANSTRPLSSASSSEMITRSIQTSCGSLSTTHSSLSERYRCVPPSFLAKLHNLGEQRQAPIYVIYPNYALPDLGFVKTSTSPDVIFSPFNYKMTLDSAGSDATSTASLKKQRSNRSVNENELFKTLDYKHISDWHSLALLLPVEYRRRLQHIPEVRQISSQLDTELLQRPLFCMTPPIRRNRPNVCDCVRNLQQNQAQTQLDDASSSGSSQPPSSGYRGSSTLLTDSEVDADPLKQMYVYQYEQQRMDSGMETIPASRNVLATGQTPPQPMPRSILRKANSVQARTKRNSMIEAKQPQQLSKLEKRRSLQEPPHNYALGSTDELAKVFEEEEHTVQTQTTKQRLSRKDLDARARAENFLTSLPRSELKYYAEIASILESSCEQVQYDAAALKKEVSRVLSQQKKVKFNDVAASAEADLQKLQAKRFSTPPNSPNISIAALQRRETLDVQEQRKIESNRFKRLQIQWELMSKDSSMLKELANEQATKSGGSTPTSTNSPNSNSNSAQKSRIPRPVSYPAGRVSSAHDAASSGKCSTRSPSRIVQPKRYSLATTPTSTTITAGRARTPTNRAGSTVTTPNTPKRQGSAQSSRPTSRVR